MRYAQNMSEQTFWALLFIITTFMQRWGTLMKIYMLSLYIFRLELARVSHTPGTVKPLHTSMADFDCSEVYGVHATIHERINLAIPAIPYIHLYTRNDIPSPISLSTGSVTKAWDLLRSNQCCSKQALPELRGLTTRSFALRIESSSVSAHSHS